MEFDPNAKANTVSAALRIVKWIIWGVTAFIVFLLYLARPEEDPDWNYRGIVIVLAGLGYGLGYLVQRYHDTILREHQSGTNEFNLQSIDAFLANATVEEKQQLDEAWEAPKDNIPLNGIQLNEVGLQFMRTAYKRKLSQHDKRRILLSLYSGADVSLLYDMLPEEPVRRRMQ